jgi:mRNA interferase HigB
VIIWHNLAFPWQRQSHYQTVIGSQVEDTFRSSIPFVRSHLLDEFSQNGNIGLAFPNKTGNFMRVISRKHLNQLANRHPDSKAELDAWFHEAEGATWTTPAHIKQLYGNASILKDSRVVFNICGNKFRLVVKINYPYSIVYVRFAGTHKEYDDINAREI